MRPLRAEASADPDLVELTDAKRAELITHVEASEDMPETEKTRMLGQLEEAKVPASLVRRIENLAGG